jgi:hypothetical protein
LYFVGYVSLLTFPEKSPPILLLWQPPCIVAWYLSFRHWCVCLSSHQGILFQLHTKEQIVSHETIWVCVAVKLHLHYREGSCVYLPVMYVCSSHILV